jgi:hypothetical protein
MFLVVRRALNEEGSACDDQYGSDTGSRVPLRLFADRTAATAYVAELLAKARQTLNPFPFLNGYLSDEVCEQLKRFQFPLSCPDNTWHGDWREWWDLIQDKITDDQRTAVWNLFADHPLFEVLVVEVNEE